MNLFQLLQILLGTAESIVPIFIHNPQSQKIEAVVMATADHALAAAAAVSAAAPAANSATSGVQPK